MPTLISNIFFSFMPSREYRNASTAYVAGFIFDSTDSHAGTLLKENNAPLKKYSGNATKLTISWKPSKLSMKLPIARPKDVKANDSMSTITMNDTVE